VSKEGNDPTFSFPAELDVDLSLEDTAAQKLRGMAVKARTGVSGYNPYDTVAVASSKPTPAAPEAPRRPTDLRKLSEWIRLQRQVEALKKEKP